MILPENKEKKVIFIIHFKGLKYSLTVRPRRWRIRAEVEKKVFPHCPDISMGKSFLKNWGRGNEGKHTGVDTQAILILRSEILDLSLTD